MNNWERWLILCCLAQIIVTVFFILYFIYLFTILSASIGILNDLLPRIIEHNQEIEKAGELLQK